MKHSRDALVKAIAEVAAARRTLSKTLKAGKQAIVTMTKAIKAGKQTMVTVTKAQKAARKANAKAAKTSADRADGEVSAPPPPTVPSAGSNVAAFETGDYCSILAAYAELPHGETRDALVPILEKLAPRLQAL